MTSLEYEIWLHDYAYEWARFAGLDEDRALHEAKSLVEVFAIAKKKLKPVHRPIYGSYLRLYGLYLCAKFLEYLERETHLDN